MNFHKYLIDPEGAIAGLWPSRVKPLDADIAKTIESLLGKG